ncbi:MAG TPA: hypothetical protein VFW71_05960 [Actinomycetota bacterium]|nr:hypothetical protein [Actinomycetota bacterium]
MAVGEGKGHLVPEGGRGPHAGLWNVGADCLRERRSLWPEIIARHVKIGLVDPVQEFMNLSPSAVRRSVYLRLVAANSIPEGWCTYARDVAPGLVEVLNIHRREASALVSDQYLDQLGGLEKLREWGEANLRILEVKAKGCEILVSPEGGIFRVLYDESTFTASRILTPDRLLQQLYGSTSMGLGMVVALPNRNEVAVHRIEDDSLLQSIGALAKFARLQYRDSPGPLSYHVYWVTEDRFEQVIGADRHGGAVPMVSPAFAAVMDQAMRIPAPWAAGPSKPGLSAPRRARRAAGERRNRPVAM